jgi:hypothetical protein
MVIFVKLLYFTYEAKLVVTKSLQLEPANIVRLPKKQFYFLSITVEGLVFIYSK